MDLKERLARVPGLKPTTVVAEREKVISEENTRLTGMYQHLLNPPPTPPNLVSAAGVMTKGMDPTKAPVNSRYFRKNDEGNVIMALDSWGLLTVPELHVGKDTSVLHQSYDDRIARFLSRAGDPAADDLLAKLRKEKALLTDMEQEFNRENQRQGAPQGWQLNPGHFVSIKKGYHLGIDANRQLIVLDEPKRDEFLKLSEALISVNGSLRMQAMSAQPLEAALKEIELFTGVLLAPFSEILQGARPDLTGQKIETGIAVLLGELATTPDPQVAQGLLLDIERLVMAGLLYTSVKNWTPPVAPAPIGGNGWKGPATQMMLPGSMTPPIAMQPPPAAPGTPNTWNRAAVNGPNAAPVYGAGRTPTAYGGYGGYIGPGVHTQATPTQAYVPPTIADRALQRIWEATTASWDEYENKPEVVVEIEPIQETDSRWERTKKQVVNTFRRATSMFGRVKEVVLKRIGTHLIEKLVDLGIVAVKMAVGVAMSAVGQWLVGVPFRAA